MDLFLSAGNVVKSYGTKHDETLVEAALHVHLEVVRFLLEQGVDVGQQSRTGATALHYASYAGDDNMIRLLLDKGARVDTPNALKTRPLMMAVERGRLTSIRILLKAGAQIDGHGQEGEKTPLQHACGCVVDLGQDIQYGVVQQLVLAGADINRGTPPPLELALQRGSVDMVEMLLHGGARVYPYYREQLKTATDCSSQLRSGADELLWLLDRYSITNTGVL